MIGIWDWEELSIHNRCRKLPRNIWGLWCEFHWVFWDIEWCFHQSCGVLSSVLCSLWGFGATVGVEPEPLSWKCWVQDFEPPENAIPHGALIDENSPNGLHINIKTNRKTWAQSCTSIDRMIKATAKSRHPKTHYYTQHYPSERRDPAPSTRTQKQISPTRKSSQGICPTTPMGSRLHN